MEKKLSTKKKPIPLSIKIVYLIILGFIAWQSFVYVSPIKGRVVDAETGKPMQGVNVRSGWVTGYINPGGGSFRTFKIDATKTDANGEFILSRTIKLKIPIIENYQGVNMLIYEHEYVCQYIERRAWREGEKTKYYEIALRKIKDDEEFNNNFRYLYSELFYDLPNKSSKYNDFTFMNDEFRMFLEQHPKSRFLENNYLILASVYIGEMGERTEDYEAAIKWSKEFIKRYPNAPDSVTNRIKGDIERFKKLLTRSKERGGR